MKATYFLLVLGLFFAISYSLPVENDEALEDEFSEGNSCNILDVLNFWKILLTFSEDLKV